MRRHRPTELPFDAGNSGRPPEFPTTVRCVECESPAQRIRIVIAPSGDAERDLADYQCSRRSCEWASLLGRWEARERMVRS